MTVILLHKKFIISSSKFLLSFLLLLLFSLESSNAYTKGLSMNNNSSNKIKMTTPSASTTNNPNNGPLELYYFGVFARVASVFALEHSGLEYIYKRPDNWKGMKPTLSWGCLPCLKNLPPDHTVAFTRGSRGGNDDNADDVGQELAILYYIAAVSPSSKMKGASLSDELISMQLFGEGEDIYKHLVNIKYKLVSNDHAINFWSKNKQDPASHNKDFGIYVILELLEKFYTKCNDDGTTGKFTDSGCTVGECKLWTSLHCVHMIDPAVLDDPQYMGVNDFYKRFKSLPATQKILNDSTNVFRQYFMKLEGL